MDALKEVTEYLQTDRSLIGGRDLYNRVPGKNRALNRTFATLTETPSNLATLHYNLAKAVGMSERTLKILLQKPLQKPTVKLIPENPPAVPPGDELPPATTAHEKLLQYNTETTSYHEAVALVKELEIETANRKAITLYAALEAARDKYVQQQLESQPLPLKQAFKLREQFPFLAQADCPDVLKIVVNDLITCYDTFRENQPLLHEALTDEHRKKIADTVVDNYIQNKEAWAELEHYQETGELLGKHPIFERLAKKEEITKMDTPTLNKKIHALTVNINRNKKKENNELVARDQDLLAHAEAELSTRK
ncbi:hypothetical protein EZY14_002715 [Kordia sp. TARA_039_SRF]|nr:hypothetical protein EZY14_002715 [Kordia sp. TARA_039_SRF]